MKNDNKERSGSRGCIDIAAQRDLQRGPRAMFAAVTLALLLGVGLLPTTFAKEPDPYLQAINAEGNRLEFLGRAKQEQEALQRLEATEKKQEKPQQQQPAKPTMAAAPASTKSFEEELQKSFPGSYALYSLMDANEKQQVFSEYKQRNSEGAGRFIPVIKKIITITNAKRAHNQ